MPPKDRKPIAAGPQRSKRRGAGATVSAAADREPLPPDEVAAALPAAPAQRLLDAGIKALDEVRHDVASRQGRVFEAILGVNPMAKPEAPADAASDPFGFRKFEDVFDQRVARALERLGTPSAAEIEALRAEVKRLRHLLERDKAPAVKRSRGS